MALNLDFDLTCPKCNKSFRQKLKDTSPGKSRECPYCGTNIAFEGDDMNKTEKKLENAIKQFDRDIKINLKF